MPHINIIRKGKPYKQYIKEIEELKILNKTDVMNLAPKTRDKMREVISQNKKRPGSKGEFEEAIDVTIKRDGWGVGDIVKLNAQFGQDMWAALNFGTGTRHPAAGKKVPLGSFRPGKGKPNPEQFRKGRWRVGEGKFTFVPKNPIPAINYAEKTYIFLRKEIREISRKFQGKLKRV